MIIKKFKVTFTYWSDEQDVREIIFCSASALQGALITLSENDDIELLDVDVIKVKL